MHPAATNDQALSPFLLPIGAYRSLRRFCLILYLIIIFAIVFHDAHIYSIIGAILIASFSILPAFVWFELPNRGLPLFPAFTVPFIWSYSLPLVIGHPDIQRYTPTQHLDAALWITFFLAIATVTWWSIVRVKNQPPRSCYCLRLEHTNQLLTMALIVSCAFYTGTALSLIRIPYGMFVIVNSFISIISTLSYFILGYLWGAGRINAKQKLIFIFFLLVNCFMQAQSLVLMIPTTQILIAVIALLLGKRRPPILLGLFLVFLFIFLHFGKYEMRKKYWTKAHAGTITILDIPKRVTEWYGYSIDYFFSQKPLEESQSVKKDRNFLERVSLMHRFLDVRTRASHEVKLLNGRSYKIILQSILPRIIYRNKLSPHRSAFMLSEAYLWKENEGSGFTHVAWGVLAEAWANFAHLGLLVLAIFMAIVIGMITRYSAYTPLRSFRSCLAIGLVPIIFNTDSTMSVKTSAFFQGTCILLALAMLYMKSYPLVQSEKLEVIS